MAGADFLRALFAAAGLERAVLVSPSMSGAFSLPFVAEEPQRVQGFVPIAPVAIARHADALRGSEVPALILWGSADATLPPAQAAVLAACFSHAEVALFEGAKHPCYLDDPARFHALLVEFARRVP